MAGAAVTPFPMPDSTQLAAAYLDLDIAENGTVGAQRELGNPALLPRPWDLATCTKPALRREVWEWLERVVIWFNHDVTWDLNAGMIPACWPKHPHLVNDIGVLADQRRRAAIDPTSTSLDEWNRYGVPAFLTRLSTRAGACLNGEHREWPGALRHRAYLTRPATGEREAAFKADVDTLGPELTPPPRPGRPQLAIVDGTGARIDPSTGEVLG
jgi:hypothetical protein